MPSLASNALVVSTFKDKIAEMILVAWVDNTTNLVYLSQTLPDGTLVPFAGGGINKQISTITAADVSISVTRSTIVLKYIDLSGNLQQLFSSDYGENWTTTF